MKKNIGILVCILTLSFVAAAQVKIQNLLTENLTDPIGLDIKQPRFSWQLASDKRNVSQTAYEIKVFEGKSAVWSPGKVNSSESVHIPYNGPALGSGKKYTWQARVWDNNGKEAQSTIPAFFQMALLNASDWKAKWIEPGYKEDSVMRPSPMFRKEFAANKKIVSAIAYITAHDLYEAEINGRRVGDAYLTPGWTSYKKRLQYQTYDVTNLVKNDGNAIGVTLASGWYRGTIGFTNNINMYGKDIALLFQLNITYSDGSAESVVSDNTWKSSTGPIRYSEIYNGETINAGMDKAGWSLPGYNDTQWSGVKVANHPMNVLLAIFNEPVRKQETFKPVRIFKTPKGEQVIDFGQNLVGWVVLKAKGKAGDTITVSHAEVLDKQGNFYTTNLRAAKSQDNYILKGDGEETFEPHFTWHGFQFVRIEGYRDELKPENFTAVALYSDMKPTGTFTSSNALVNAIGDWMYRSMVGLDTYEDGVGYRHIKVKPNIGGGFTNASATLQTYYGPLANGWKVDNNKILMDVEIPVNTTATVYVPATAASAITESGGALTLSKGIQVTGAEDGYVVLQLGSGTYHFAAAKPADASTTINLSDYAGKYKVEGGMVKLIEVKMQNGKLAAVVFNNTGELEPVKNAKDQFTSADGSTTTFIRDAQGKVSKVKMGALGMTLEGVRQ